MQELLRQIHDQIPRQAQRLHLAHRRDQLAESLAVDFAEYSSLEAQLRSDSETPTSPLDASIRDAISTAVVPAWDQRRRQDRRVAALLSLLVLLYFLPLSLGEVVRWGLQVLMEPLNNYGPTVASVVAWGIFAVVLLMWGVDRATRGTSVRTRLAALKPARALYRRFAVVVVGFSGLASLLLAAVLYETLTYPYYHSQSEQAAVGTMLVLGILGVSAAVYVLARHVVIARKRTTSLREEQRP